MTDSKATRLNLRQAGLQALAGGNARVGSGLLDPQLLGGWLCLCLVTERLPLRVPWGASLEALGRRRSSFTHHPREKNNKKRKPVFCLYILTYSYFDPWSLAFIITLTLTHMTEQLKLHFTESSFTKFAFWLSNQLKIFRFSFNTWGYLTLAHPLNHKSVILWSIC